VTTYRVSGQVHDMHRVVSLLRAERRRAPRLSWPLVLAEAGPHLIGAVGTTLTHGLVICGPLVLQRELGRRAAVIAYRLGELYDQTVGALGIRAYYVHIPVELTQYRYVIERLGFERLEVPEDPGYWYRRTPGRWGQVLDSSHAEVVDGLRQRLQAVERS
jgi:hypothetical protein